MDRACGMCGLEKRGIQVCCWEIWGPEPLLRPRHRWEVNIKTCLQDIGSGRVLDWYQDRDKWLAGVGHVNGLQGPIRCKECLSSWGNLRFWGSSLRYVYHWLIGRLVGWLVVWLVDWSFSWLIGHFVGWLVVSLVDWSFLWLIGRLVGCLVSWLLVWLVSLFYLLNQLVKQLRLGRKDWFQFQAAPIWR
jgi:hypothetical protein